MVRQYGGKGLMDYLIYRKPDGSLDCVPASSRLYSEAMKTMVALIPDSMAFSAWARLVQLERAEHPEQKGMKRR